MPELRQLSENEFKYGPWILNRIEGPKRVVWYCRKDQLPWSKVNDVFLMGSNGLEKIYQEKFTNPD